MTVYAIVKFVKNERIFVDRHSEDTGVDSIWLAQKKGGLSSRIELFKPGYGMKGNYGNGSGTLLTDDMGSFKMLSPWVNIESPILGELANWARS